MGNMLGVVGRDVDVLVLRGHQELGRGVVLAEQSLLTDQGHVLHVRLLGHIDELFLGFLLGVAYVPGFLF